jgi:hypothetical protein
VQPHLSPCSISPFWPGDGICIGFRQNQGLQGFKVFTLFNFSRASANRRNFKKQRSEYSPQIAHYKNSAIGEAIQGSKSTPRTPSPFVPISCIPTSFCTEAGEARSAWQIPRPSAVLTEYGPDTAPSSLFDSLHILTFRDFPGPCLSSPISEHSLRSSSVIGASRRQVRQGPCFSSPCCKRNFPVRPIVGCFNGEGLRGMHRRWKRRRE